MSSCKFPDHHSSSGGGLAALVLAIVAAVVIGVACQVAAFVAQAVAFLVSLFVPVAVGLAVMLAARVGWSVWWLVRMGPVARRNWPRAVWARLRWRWLCRNLRLAYHDKQTKRVPRLRIPFTTAVHVVESNRHLERYPRARFRPDPYGWVATVRTIPRTGRKEIEAHAAHIGDAWGCHRVQVTQPRPGRVLVRGLRRDPLAESYPLAAVPPGALAPDDWSLYVGRDEWAEHRYLRLGRNLTGVTVGGLPGYGKTSLVNSWLCQLAPRRARMVLIDGKGGADYSSWADRAWLHCGDSLPDAVACLEDAHAEMRDRLAIAPGNAWRAEDFELLLVVIDECHTFFDLDAVKGNREAEQQVRACRALTGQLVKKGGSVMVLTVLLTQKQTSDAIPTAIRDNCGFGLSFAVKTRDAAVAALGEQIREHPGYCPSGLQDPAYVGVCTATMRTGLDPFVRLRTPEIPAEHAAQVAASTVDLAAPEPQAACDLPAVSSAVS